MKFDMPDCGACRSCEMACSYYHTGEFKPSVSSLKIIKKDNGRGNQVELAEISTGSRFACNGCVDQTEPMCVEVCEQAELLIDFVQTHLENSKEQAEII